MNCQHCHQPIEPVDGPGIKFPFRHSESKKIVCFDVYKPEMATPAIREAG